MTVLKIRQAIQKTLEKVFYAVWRVLDLGCDLKGIVRLIFLQRLLQCRWRLDDFQVYKLFCGNLLFFCQLDQL